MENQGSDLNFDIAVFSRQLLTQQELTPRARTTARAVAEFLPGTAASVYLLGKQENESVWIPKASAGEVSVQASAVAADQGALGELLEQKSALIYSGRELQRETYSHLDIRKTLGSLAYLPLMMDDTLLGAIEILNFEGKTSEKQLSALAEMAEVSAAALAAAHTYENERHEALTSISRLTQLYDLEKVFSSTLEMDELLPIIGRKIREVMECQGVNIWLLRGDETVELMHQAGIDPTTQQGNIQKPGEGLAGDVSDNGEALLIDDPEDHRLAKRNQGIAEAYV